jgi:hypothetical protein
MASVSRSRPERRIRLLLAPAADHPGVVRIDCRGDSDLYFLTPVPADFGLGFKLTRRDYTAGAEATTAGDEYHVNLGGGPVNSHLCECKGFCRWGHCKHVEGLLALSKAGQLVSACDRDPFPKRCPCGDVATAGSQCLRCADLSDDRTRRVADAGLDDL